MLKYKMYVNQSLDFIELILSKIMSKIEKPKKSSIHLKKKGLAILVFMYVTVHDVTKDLLTAWHV